MISCNYKGQEIVILDYLNKNGFAGIENLITASKNKELICKEADCRLPLQFVNSEKRIKHFRHYRGAGENCFFRNNSQSEDIIEVQSKLYSYFSNLNGISISADSKIAGSYTHLILKNEQEIILVINIMKRSLPVDKWISMHEEYKKRHIKDIWINISEKSSKQNTIMMYSLDQYQIERGSENIAIYYDNKNNTIIFKIKYQIDKQNLKYPYINYPDIITKTIPLNHFLSDGDTFSAEQIDKCRKEMIRNFDSEIFESQAKEELALKQAEETKKLEEETKRKSFESNNNSVSDIDVSVYKYVEDQQLRDQISNNDNYNEKKLCEHKFDNVAVEELYTEIFGNPGIGSFNRAEAAGQIVTCINRIMEGQDLYVKVLKKALFDGPDWSKYYETFKFQRNKAKISGDVERYNTYCRISS